MAIGRRRELPLTSDAARPCVIETPSDIARGVAFLLSREPRFAPVIDIHGMPSPRRVENSLASLLEIITYQLISLQAAKAIWQRLEARLQPFAPERILALEIEHLKQLGLSGAKARSFLAIAEAVRCGDLDFASLAQMSDHDVLKKLVALPGIGQWTADIYLLSALGRADACPSGDLALQLAAQSLFALGERPLPKAFLLQAEAWRPWRSVASRLLWSHYRGLKGLSQKVN